MMVASLVTSRLIVCRDDGAVVKEELLLIRLSGKEGIEGGVIKEVEIICSIVPSWYPVIRRRC